MAPGVDMDDASYKDYVERNYRWNFFANTGDLTAVNLARAFIFTTTILPLYASYLTSSAVLIGLIPAILEVGFLLPQLFTARKAETLERMLPFVVKVSVWERLPYLFIALTIFLWPGAPGWFAYTMLALNIAVASGSGGLATPAWKTMLGKVIHPDRKGLMFALGSGIGGFLGIGGAYIARNILANNPYPISYAYCFFLSFLGQALSWLFLTFNREPAKNMQPRQSSIAQYIRELPVILKSDRNFARYLLGQLFIVFGAMGVSFYVIYARERFGISDQFAASLTIIALVSQSAGIPLLGWLGDRLGHKIMTEWSIILGAGSLLTIIFLPGPGWLGLVFVLMNLSMAGVRIARMSITMEFSSIERLPTYTAISGTLMAVPTFLAPVLGGWCIDLFGYRPAFIAALFFSVIGLAITHRWVRDPRRGEMRESK